MRNSGSATILVAASGILPDAFAYARWKPANAGKMPALPFSISSNLSVQRRHGF